MDRLTASLDHAARGSSLDRRQLVKGLAAAAAVAAFPSGTAEAEAPALLGAAAAPLRATWVNHYTYIAPDLNKTVDWYIEVFGMQKGFSNSREVHLWFGDRGGDTLMIVRQANPGEQTPGLEKFGITIDNWDQKAVEAELRGHGLHPITETDRGFWFNDLEGNEVGVFAKDYMTRPAAPAGRPALWKALSVNHMQLISADHVKLAAWYRQVLNMKQNWEGPQDAFVWFGDSIIVTNKGREGRITSAALHRLDHVAYTVANYDHAAVEKELTRRGLKPRADFPPYSFNCVDINGFPTQVCDLELVPAAERQLLKGKK